MFIAALNSLQRKFREGQLLLAVEDGRSVLLSPLVKIFQSLEIPYKNMMSFACSFIMMSLWACNNSAPVRHNNNTHTVPLCLTFSLFCFLPPALLLSDAVWFESIPNRPGAKPWLWHLWRALFSCWQSLFNVKLITFFWTVYGNKLDVK